MNFINFITSLAIICIISVKGITADNAVHTHLSQEQIVSQSTVNFMWIHSQNEQDVVAPETFNRHFREVNKVIRINILSRLDGWAEFYPQVNLWYDSAMISPELKDDAVTQMRELISTKCRNADRISLKDIRDLNIVRQNEHAFNQDMPMYFRVDLLRVVAMYTTLEQSSPNSFFMYSDLSLKPHSPDEILTDQTIQHLHNYGIVMAKTGDTRVYENSFQIIGNNQPNILRAINHAIIGRSLRAAPAVLSGSGDSCSVYSYYRDMFSTFYFLEGKAEFNKDITEVEELSTDLSNFDKVFPIAYGRSQCLINITDPKLKPQEYSKETSGIYFNWHLFIPTVAVKIPASTNAWNSTSSYKFDDSDEFAPENSEQETHSEQCTIS